jgi:hypothetical protein
MACALTACATLAMAQANLRNFDHVKTGFPLAGVHANERCESCHVNGVFKGTPRDCATCHAAGSPLSRTNVVKPPRHIPTTQGCDSCHNTQTFAGARFTHTGVVPGTCQSCHNGLMAPGKSAGHIATQASCDSCHRTSAWSPATGFDHASVVPGTCGTCHNGARATGKPAAHMPVAASPACDSCHSTGTWRPTRWNHTQAVVTNQCSTCHSGSYPPADGRPANHVPYQALAGVPITNCDTCHRSGFAAWAPARVHSSVSISTQCASCHTGSFPPAVGRPNTPIHAGATVCETCHRSTATWASARVDHSTFTAATNCTTCHNGSTATGKPAAHIPVAATNCISCHSTTTWRPTSWNHTQTVVTNQCSTCHSGAYPPADGRPANHVPYQTLAGVPITNCDTCHRSGYAAWAPARVHSSVSISTQCASCHTGSFPPAVGRPNTAIHVGATVCETCHRSTATWASARVDHSTFTAATNCTTCHNGSTATGKPAAHIPVAATNCISCHSTTTWRPTSWNHTQTVVTNQCSTCHSGAYPPADGRPTAHIPYQLISGAAITNCDSCHRAGYAAWTPARFHSNVSVSTQCATCHTGSYPPAVGRPNTAVHVGVTVCESCHRSTTSWTSVTFAHSPANAVGTGTCDTCHNGSTARGKPSTHIPVTTGVARCDSCHRSQAAWATAVTMNHTVVTGSTCRSCHNGSYTSQGNTGALAKPANHIPETQLLNGTAMDCNACHTGTTSWTTVRMNHNASQGNGSGWCKSCHASGTNFLGGMEKKSLTHQQRSPAPTDCSQSGCHRPLGNRGTAYTRW